MSLSNYMYMFIFINTHECMSQQHSNALWAPTGLLPPPPTIHHPPPTIHPHYHPHPISKPHHSIPTKPLNVRKHHPQKPSHNVYQKWLWITTSVKFKFWTLPPSSFKWCTSVFPALCEPGFKNGCIAPSRQSLLSSFLHYVVGFYSRCKVKSLILQARSLTWGNFTGNFQERP